MAGRFGYPPGWGKHLILAGNHKVIEKNEESKRNAECSYW